MLPDTNQMIRAQASDWTFTVTKDDPDEFGVRFALEYGHGLDYAGTLYTATTLSGSERSHYTHTVSPELAFGWPSESLRDAVMPRLREVALHYRTTKREGHSA